jgi:hypothetical protein
MLSHSDAIASAAMAATSLLPFTVDNILERAKVYGFYGEGAVSYVESVFYTEAYDVAYRMADAMARELRYTEPNPGSTVGNAAYRAACSVSNSAAIEATNILGIE